MNELLNLAIDAHGGLARWKAVSRIEVTLTISGGLLEIKGFPERLKDVTVSIDVDRLCSTLRPYSQVDAIGIFTPDRIWIEGNDHSILAARDNPRAAFSGHVRATPWDQLHRLYFLGYAMWNYMTTPFLFARPDFEIEERPPHQEDRETWRVLQVTFPDTIPTHCKSQLFYFDEAGILKRIDYKTDVAGGVASHYCYDPHDCGGLAFPMRRRVVQRSPDGPCVSGPTVVFLDLTAVRLFDRPSHYRNIE